MPTTGPLPAMQENVFPKFPMTTLVGALQFCLHPQSRLQPQLFQCHQNNGNRNLIKPFIITWVNRDGICSSSYTHSDSLIFVFVFFPLAFALKNTDGWQDLIRRKLDPHHLRYLIMCVQFSALISFGASATFLAQDHRQLLQTLPTVDIFEKHLLRFDNRLDHKFSNNRYNFPLFSGRPNVYFLQYTVCVACWTK